MADDVLSGRSIRSITGDRIYPDPHVLLSGKAIVQTLRGGIHHVG